MHEHIEIPSVPSVAEATTLVEQGNALLQQGNLPAAARCYRAALAMQPDRFEAHANLGAVLLALHHPAEAERHLRHAALQRPREVPLHLALARACGAQGNHAAAEAACAEVLRLVPDHPDALLERAGALRRLGRFEDAAEDYRLVLERAPQTALAHYGLGHCRRERGDADEAAACFERALAVQPDYIDAHYRLAVLRAGTAAPQRLAQLEALAPQLARMQVAQQVRYWFTLGRLREDLGAADAAFAAYAEGNGLQTRRMGTAGYTAAREAVDARFIERIHAVFDSRLLQRPATGKTDPRVPVFIVGMPRSGTSLLEQMLAAHPAVHGAGELPDFPEVLEAAFRLEEDGLRAYPEVVPDLAPAALRRAGKAYLDRAWKGVAGASHVTDKLTGNFLHAGMIRLAIPQAKIIHIERDPRDTCFSCYANLFKFGNITYSYDLETLGRYYVRSRELMRHWHEVLPAATITRVRYEDLVRDAEGELRRILEFLGLPWDDRCLAFHRARRAVRTVSVGQVGRPVYASSVQRWQRFETHIKPLLNILDMDS